MVREKKVKPIAIVLYESANNIRGSVDAGGSPFADLNKKNDDKSIGDDELKYHLRKNEVYKDILKQAINFKRNNE